MIVTVNRGGLDVRAADGSLVQRWAGGVNRRSLDALWHYARAKGGAWLTVAEQVATV